MTPVPTSLYLNGYFNPVDLESYSTSSGHIEFDSISSSVIFISHNPSFKLIDGEYVKFTPTYHSIQKHLKRYGYFKAYTYINGFFLSYMIKA